MFLFLNLLPSEAITTQPATEIVAPINIQKEKVKVAQVREGNREILEIEIPTTPNISPFYSPYQYALFQTRPCYGIFSGNCCSFIHLQDTTKFPVDDNISVYVIV